MSNASHELGVFLHLAQASLRRRRPLVRDRMLVLAGVIAWKMQLPKLSEYCRQIILQNNPRHLIGHSATVDDAMLDDDFLTLLDRLRQRYPLERAERLLESLGIELSNERDTYYSDEVWAAAILNVAPDSFVADESF